MAILSFGTACSLNPHAGHVDVFMEVKQGQDTQLSLINGRSLAQAFMAPAGTTVNSFDCLMVDISGAGIPVTIPDFAHGDPTSCNYPSALSKIVDGNAGGAIELSVPSGTNRSVRVIGFISNSPNGCPYVNRSFLDVLGELESQGTSMNGPVFFEAVLGEKVTDLLTDTTIEVRSNFDPANVKQPFGCDDEMGNGPMEWKVATAKVSGTTCVLPGNGMVRCWGDGTYGELGDGFGNDVNGKWVSTGPGTPLNGVRDLKAGDAHFCARTDSNSLYCWGKNDQGQIGNNTIVNREYATLVTPPGMVKHFDLGSGTTCASDYGQNVYCWGDDMYGQLGNGGSNVDSLVPVLTGTFTYVEQVALGSQTGCVIDNGAVKCWGSDSFGALGDGGTSADVNSPPVGGITLPFPAIQMSMGEFTGCATLTSGAIYCWGQGTDGERGDNNSGTPSIYSPVPSLIDGSGGGVARKVVVGGNFGCAVLNTGQIKCWGRGAGGQIGNGGFADSMTPDFVTGPPQYTDIALGFDFACALSGPFVSCWGNGTGGRLGNLAGTGTNLPTGVSVVLAPF